MQILHIATHIKEESPIYHYILCRLDAEVGKMMAQAVHAAEYSTPHPIPDNMNAVILGIPNKEELFKIGQELTALDINHTCIYEPDPPFLGEMTAIGVSPIYKTEITERIFRKYKLYRK